MAEWTIESLNSSHSRKEFSCGKPSLDDFLHSLVSQYEKRGLGRTYVAIRQGEKDVQAYYTLASGSVSFQNLPPVKSSKLPKHPVPVALLGRLAVNKGSRGKGLGRELLRDALLRCLELSKNLGIYAVEVFALDAEARRFYMKFGFMELQDDQFHLFLPLKTIDNVFGGTT